MRDIEKLEAYIDKPLNINFIIYCIQRKKSRWTHKTGKNIKRKSGATYYKKNV